MFQTLCVSVGFAYAYNTAQATAAAGACAMKNMQFGPYLWPNRQNSCIIQEIGVSEHDGDVRFLSGSRIIGVSRMRNKKYTIWPIFMDESPKFLHLIGNRGR